jgi:GNAT superfamily N-acetyltransferase
MLTIRPFTPADIALGMGLKSAAGWNQTEADWRRTLQLQPDGCFVGECDGTPAATLTFCCFGSVAWIAMVLTDPEFRGRGLATALMRHAVELLQSRGVTTIRLDATPLGRPVYERLGFAVDYELNRWKREVLSAAAIDDSKYPGLRQASPEDLGAIVELDRQTVGCDRSKFLAALLAESPAGAFITDGAPCPAGFALRRLGSNAMQLGPIVATDPKVGRLLLSTAIAETGKTALYCDAPTKNTAAEISLRAVGFSSLRPLYRMTIGMKRADDVACLWASSGPEKG